MVSDRYKNEKYWKRELIRTVEHGSPEEIELLYEEVKKQANAGKILNFELKFKLNEIKNYMLTQI